MSDEQVDEFVAVEVIENTAARLGVDPVAFAKACQDGQRLAEALLCMTRHPNFGRIYKDWLAALKRAESQPARDPDDTGRLG